MHEDLVPPDSIKGLSAKEVAPYKSEYDVSAGLENIGHEVRKLGVSSDLGVLRDAITEWNPDITFNLLEEFHGVAVYDQHVVGYLELMRKPYTGCNPRGLLLAHDKALTKEILSYHRDSRAGLRRLSAQQSGAAAEAVEVSAAGQERQRRGLGRHRAGVGRP